MTFKELCEARYSCRKYKALPIEAEKLEYIKECVRMAPSAVNKQPWKFIYISEPEMLSKVKQSYHREWIDDVPAIILCLENREECWTRRYDNKNHADIDIAIATEHLCLAATEQGLATCWVCNFDINQLKELVAVPEGYEPAVLIPIGYADDETTPKVRKAMEEVWEMALER